MSRITGEQARELLEGSRLARSGNWCDKGDAEEMLDPLAYHDVSGDAALLAAASHLAETVAWLYGNTPNDLHKWEPEHFTVFIDGNRDVVLYDCRQGFTFNPEQAVELARAILAAVEKARQ